MLCWRRRQRDTVILKWEERSEGRVTEYSCGEVLSKREDISKSFHIYNLILSLNVPEASKLGLIIFIFQRRIWGAKRLSDLAICRFLHIVWWFLSITPREDEGASMVLLMIKTPFDCFWELKGFILSKLSSLLPLSAILFCDPKVSWQ